MDIERLLNDYDINHVAEGDSHRHARDGWINVECPFCSGSGNEGFHLGFNLYDHYWKCWRCGWKPMVKALSEILKLSKNDVYPLLKQYGVIHSYSEKKPKDKKEFLLPSNVTKLKDRHIQYLKNRGYRIDKIQKVWGLKGTGPLSSLDDGYGKVLDYRFRIIIPFPWNGETVSFDSRDITNMQLAKYQACPASREAIGHKKILYGNQEAWEDTGICVEGPSDVWRFGEQSFAVSGIEYTPEQVREIANAFKKVAVVFDGNEDAAKNKAKRLVKDLQFKNVDAYRVQIKGDPGEMSQKDANKLVKNILNK